MFKFDWVCIWIWIWKQNGKKFLFSLLARGRRQPSTGVLLPLRATLSSFSPRTAQFPRCSLRSGPARVASEQAWSRSRSAAWHRPHAPSLPRWLPWPTRQMFLLARNRHGLAMAVSFFDTSHLGTLRHKLTRPLNSSLPVPCVPHRALDRTIAPPGALV